MSDTSPALSLPLLMPSQAQKHVTHNEALMILDMVTQLAVADLPLADPPPTPATGARYIIGAAPTGHWAGHDSEIAVWDGMIWRFVMPQPGWRADVSPTGQSLRFDGSDWQTVLPQLQNLPALGVGATADASNPLTVAAAATLLTHTGAGHQLKLNKSGASDTTSLLFQTSWSGRAEMGTTGSDDFSIKVSSDGSNWQEALHIAGTTGQVHFPQGSPDLRDRLTAPRTYYVRPDGSDTNTGLSDAASGAFLTLQHAVNQALSLDNGLHDVTLQVADGSYGEDLVIADRLLGSGLLQLIGETTDPSLVSLNRITCHNGARVALAGVTLTGADALKVESGAAVTVADIHFEGSGAALSLESAEVSCADQALVLGSNLTALAHLRGHARLLAEDCIFSLGLGVAWNTGALDLSGFCRAALTGASFTGDTAGCTGPRYALAQNAILDSGGAGSSSLPGTLAGTTESGGQYL